MNGTTTPAVAPLSAVLDLDKLEAQVQRAYMADARCVAFLQPAAILDLIAQARAALPTQITGLGRVTNEDDGYLTLQFKDEAAACAFLQDYQCTVDVRDMPEMREDSAQQALLTNVEDARDAQTQAARDVLAERRRQVEKEGWTTEHDDKHGDGQMAVAAGYYALACGYPHERDIGHGGIVPTYWPWAPSWWKPKGARRNLIKAGALILAEIERIDRQSIKGATDGAVGDQS